MTVDAETRTILTAALLHLDPRIVDKRTALNTVLIEVGLFAARKACTAEEILEEIDRIVGQKGFLDQNECARAIDDCVGRSTVQLDGVSYSLAEERTSILSDAFHASDRVMDRVKNGLRGSIEYETGEPISNDTASNIFESVRRIITEEVYEFSLQLARQNLTIERMVLSLEEADPIKRIEEGLSEILPEGRELLRKRTLGGIINYFRELPPDLQAMLRLIHHNVLINQILNLDPSMIQLQKDWFARRRVYLDTNVVLGYVFEAQKRHKVVEEVILVSKKLGTQLLISPATFDELSGQVDRAKRNHKLTEKLPIMRVLASDGDDAILATFLQLQRQEPSIQWEAFISPFENLEETLFQYGILIEDEGYEEASGHPSLEAIRRAVVDAKPWFVSENVIQHDTLNCALIMQLRDTYPADERGQIVWLLTIDTSLRKAQRVLYGSGHLKLPYCIQAADWGEIVLPAQNLPEFVFEDFIGYLAQARLGAIAEPEVVQLDFLETIHDAVVDVERLWMLHPDQVRDVMVTMQASREARSVLSSVTQAEEDKERKSLQLQFQSLVDQAIDETDPVKKVTEKYDRKIGMLERRLQFSDEKIARLNERLVRAESSLAYRVSSWFRRLLGRG